MRYIIALGILFLLFYKGNFFRLVDWLDPKVRSLVYRLLK